MSLPGGESLVELAFRILGQGEKIVLFLGSSLAEHLAGVSVEDVLDEDGTGEALARLDAVIGELEESEKLAKLVGLLAECTRTGRIHRIVYTGVDGILSCKLGDTVIDVYGSITRGYCPRCGFKTCVENWREKRRCPNCGSILEPDYSRHGSPYPRKLSEALYELTTAGLILVYAASTKSLDVLLPLVASKFTRVVLLGSNQVLSRFLPSVKIEAERLLYTLCTTPHSRQEDGARRGLGPESVEGASASRLS